MCSVKSVVKNVIQIVDLDYFPKDHRMIFWTNHAPLPATHVVGTNKRESSFTGNVVFCEWS